jgi:preprotein translocase subunit Sss1
MPVIKLPPARKDDNYDPGKMAAAYKRFLESGDDFDQLAVEFEIPRSALVKYASKGKWIQRKDDIVNSVEGQAEQEYRLFLAKHRKPTAERLLKAAEKNEIGIIDDLDELQALIEDPEKPLSLKDRTVIRRRIAETLAASATVSSRAAGITDRPASIGSDGTGSRGKAPLIVIGVNAQPAKPAQPIDVEGVTIDVSEYSK